METACQRLEEIFQRIAVLRSAASVLQWDSATMMPAGGAEARGQQLAAISVLCAEEIARPEIGELIGEAKAGIANFNEWQRGNLREMERVWKHESAVPKKLVEEMSLAASECEFTWRTARKENNFKQVQGKFEKVVSLTREVAAIKGESLGKTPYDAMLDIYDPGSSAEYIEKIFSDLRGFLGGFIDKAISFQDSLKIKALPQRIYPMEKQKELYVRLMQSLGFDFKQGRLDESLHPFCGGYQGDVRITTRYDESDLFEGLMGIVHETGHALYDAGLPAQWRWQPVGQPVSMALHESQSLFMEMQICRSSSFIKYIRPLLAEFFGEIPESENIFRNLAKVKRSLIRVGADEVTYPLHVMLRFELEKQLISGSVAVKDLPDAWRQHMKEFVGIVPETDANGCMQDIHWFDGTFGYFPCYTLGALIAAQLHDAMKNDLGDTAKLVESGKFGDITAWLKEKVHCHGMLHYSPELVKMATGSELSAKAFERHLEERYLS